ncbi:hypothetical protein [Vibrio sagamiensis]|uniref:Uncharacterized protein n=1 Tax=Vibrio sagamiensis NBRC 104589 TaxID=1219064 RepID=A0A511QDS1_9VIBR|nr:hypothetical protein [Vibrio sagamiensis]GEM75326.1 hypothetical protein VSA01S_14380 [Vibrio sagamiensis NBRC 104589]
MKYVLIITLAIIGIAALSETKLEQSDDYAEGECYQNPKDMMCYNNSYPYINMEKKDPS